MGGSIHMSDNARRAPGGRPLALRRVVQDVLSTVDRQERRACGDLQRSWHELRRIQQRIAEGDESRRGEARRNLHQRNHEVGVQPACLPSHGRRVGETRAFGENGAGSNEHSEAAQRRDAGDAGGRS
uniref:(northern house mosquito) hypothetical protein n=1 Tax=Culex pipiens TaxID=7175 RepID=A0A8D8F3E8_CULPI